MQWSLLLEIVTEPHLLARLGYVRLGDALTRRSLALRHVYMCADIEQCERTDTWIKANYDSTRSRSGVRTERLRSPALRRARGQASSSVFSTCSLPSAAMSGTFLALLVCLAVLPTVVVPARYIPKWKKQVSVLLFCCLFGVRW